MTDENSVQDILSQEEKRQAALMAGDPESLGEILAPEFWLCHSTGHISDREGLMNFIHAEIEYVGLERKDVSVKVFGDVATMTGDMTNTVRGKVKGDVVVVPLQVLQVWRKAPEGWLLSSMQCTRIGKHQH